MGEAQNLNVRVNTQKTASTAWRFFRWQNQRVTFCDLNDDSTRSWVSLKFMHEIEFVFHCMTLRPSSQMVRAGDSIWNWLHRRSLCFSHLSMLAVFNVLVWCRLARRTGNQLGLFIRSFFLHCNSWQTLHNFPLLPLLSALPSRDAHAEQAWQCMYFCSWYPGNASSAADNRMLCLNTIRPRCERSNTWAQLWQSMCMGTGTAAAVFPPVFTQTRTAVGRVVCYCFQANTNWQHFFCIFFSSSADLELSKI